MTRWPPAPLSGLPTAVTVYEVGPRDGLQNEPGVVPLAVKLELIARLVAAGLRAVEVTSLVRPDAVPQLADADELLARLPASPGVRHPALVPNLRGLERALAAGVREVAVFASATESFARRNLNRSRSDEPALARRGGRTRPPGGDPGAGLRLDVLRRSLGGGRGPGGGGGGGHRSCWPWAAPRCPSATPSAWPLRERWSGCSPASPPPGSTWAPSPSTSTTPTARRWPTPLEALRCGVTTVDRPPEGSGGCPFAGSATGNLATEDLVFLLDGLGVGHRRRPGGAGAHQPVARRPAGPAQPQPGGQSPGREPGFMRRAGAGDEMSTVRPRACSLNEDHELLRATVEQFARRRGRAGDRRALRAGGVPLRAGGQDGRHGPLRPPLPRGVRRDGRRPPRSVPRRRGAGPGRLLGGASPWRPRWGWGPCPSIASAAKHQKRRWLPALCRGEALGAFALTEPGGGSDAGAVRTRARRDGDSWVIDGTKVVHHQRRHRHH